jgi:hypothetical protein
MKTTPYIVFTVVAFTASLFSQTGSINNTVGSGGSFKVKGSTSDSLLVVKDNGNVGVGAANPSEKLEVNGNLKVTGSVKIPSTTRYYSVAGGIFTPMNQILSYTKDTELLYGTSSSQTLVFFAPVNLPHGAMVTNFSATVYDNDSAQDIVVELYSFNIYFKCQSSGASSTNTTLTPTISVPDIVDNQNYAYVVRAEWTTSTVFSDIKLVRATITYTVTNPLP